jgi:hypothetical protein
MALSNGEEISYQSIAGDCGVSPNSIKNYIQNFAIVSCDRYESS